MIAAPVPVHTLTVPIVLASAKSALNKTLKAAGTGTGALTNCHTLNKHYGVCRFTMNFTSRSSGKKFKCHGTIYIRDIGIGPEKSYGTVYCNGRKVT
jgi:hypothetical protein